MKRRVYHSPGWYGLRFRPPRDGKSGYLILRDTRRHRLLFTERNRIGSRPLARLGRWQVWLKT